MRVAIDASVLGSARGGDETYLRGFITALAQTADPAIDRILMLMRRGIAPPEPLASSPSVRSRSLLPGGRLVRYGFALPLAVALADERVDVLVSINHAPFVSTVPRAVVIHDLSFLRHPELYPPSTARRLRWLVPLHIRQSRVVITGSEYSRADLIAAYSLAPDRVVVVPPVIESRTQFAPSATLAPRPYFLYVGNLHPRKNLGRLLRAFALARGDGLVGFDLVVAGATWWGRDPFARETDGVDLDGVRIVGRVPDAERDELLRGATALVYPSLFEGIGLPPLEAMAAGTPVIAANTAALPETCGGAAVLVDPYDVTAIAAALVRVAGDAALRDELRGRGAARAAFFDARRAGDAARTAIALATRGVARSFA